MTENDRTHVHDRDATLRYGADRLAEVCIYQPSRDDASFRTCHWCGSVHPQDLLKLRDAQRIAHVDRSVDWKYGWPHKVYVDVKNADQNQLYAIGSASSDERPTVGGPWVAVDEMNDEQQAAYREAHGRGDYKPRWVYFGTRPTVHAKFYSVHTLEPFLSDEEREALFAILGYRFEAVEGDRIRWSAYDYGGRG
jgi:hypothetical protein